MAEAIKLRAIAHSFEGKLFTVVSTSTISAEIIAAMSKSCRTHAQAGTQEQRVFRRDRTGWPRGRHAIDRR